MATDAGNQAGYAAVAAAFVTGLWAWFSQRRKTKDDITRDDTTAEITDHQNIVQNYREFNKQLQDRILILTGEITNLWTNLNALQVTLKDSEVLRTDSMRQIMTLESQVKELTRRTDECELKNRGLEADNSRLYRLLIERNADIKRGDGTLDR
jgi:predicted RNase H-like nuclease (RuvC/YqgF family)